MRRASCLWSIGVALALIPCVAAAERSRWDAEGVAALSTRMLEETGRLEKLLRDASAAAEAATEDPDRETGVGGRAVVLRDVAVLQTRLGDYRSAVQGGQGREETRPLFGRIASLVDLAGDDFRRLPDFARYRADLEALEKTAKELGRFYAESLEVQTPPDPLERR